jgi:hypothetical protein
VIGNADLPAEDRPGTDGDRTGQSALRAKDCSSADARVMADVDLRVERRPDADLRRAEGASINGAKRPNSHIISDVKASEMGNRERRPRRPFDEPETGRTEHRVRANDDTISKNNARVQDNPSPEDDVAPNDGGLRRSTVGAQHLCRRPASERMDPTVCNITKTLRKRWIDEQRSPPKSRIERRGDATCIIHGHEDASEIASPFGGRNDRNRRVFFAEYGIAAEACRESSKRRRRNPNSKRGRGESFRRANQGSTGRFAHFFGSLPAPLYI